MNEHEHHLTPEARARVEIDKTLRSVSGDPRITYPPGLINKVPTPNTVFFERENPMNRRVGDLNPCSMRALYAAEDRRRTQLARGS